MPMPGSTIALPGLRPGELKIIDPEIKTSRGNKTGSSSIDRTHNISTDSRLMDLDVWDHFGLEKKNPYSRTTQKFQTCKVILEVEIKNTNMIAIFIIVSL